jgi:hypothetical protein
LKDIEHIREEHAIVVRAPCFEGHGVYKDERAILVRNACLEDRCVTGKTALKLIRRKYVVISELI